MKNIKFNLLVCVDAENTIANESDIRLAVIRKLELGNRESEYVLNELRRRFEPEEGALNGFVDDAITFFDWSDYIIVNKSVLVTDPEELNNSGFYESRNSSIFHTNCEFDVEKWARAYSLEEIQEEIEL